VEGRWIIFPSRKLDLDSFWTKENITWPGSWFFFRIFLPLYHALENSLNFENFDNICFAIHSLALYSRLQNCLLPSASKEREHGPTQSASHSSQYSWRKIAKCKTQFVRKCALAIHANIALAQTFAFMVLPLSLLTVWITISDFNYINKNYFVALDKKKYYRYARNALQNSSKCMGSCLFFRFSFFHRNLAWIF